MKFWSNEITELEEFFKISKIPDEPIRIDSGSIITDLKLFIRTHLLIVRSQNGNMRYKPYLDRMRLLKSLIEDKNGNKKVENEEILSQKHEGIMIN